MVSTKVWQCNFSYYVHVTTYACVGREYKHMCINNDMYVYVCNDDDYGTKHNTCTDNNLFLKPYL